MNAKDLKMADGSSFIDYLKDNALDNNTPMDEWTAGYETCKSRLAKILLPQIEQETHNAELSSRPTLNDKQEI